MCRPKLPPSTAVLVRWASCLLRAGLHRTGAVIEGEVSRVQGCRQRRKPRRGSRGGMLLNSSNQASASSLGRGAHGIRTETCDALGDPSGACPTRVGVRNGRSSCCVRSVLVMAARLSRRQVVSIHQVPSIVNWRRSTSKKPSSLVAYGSGPSTSNRRHVVSWPGGMVAGAS